MIGEEAELFFTGPRRLLNGSFSGTEIDAAHDNPGRRAFELSRLEFA